ncbi:MAG TPA: cytochrome P460 family protein [Vicinamibacteria bacterium]|nr:cytochrome P460 family protein [Vicinamibacteria bacterium]
MTKQSNFSGSRARALARILGSLAILALAACSSVSESQPRRESTSGSLPKPAIDANNVMTRPEGYRYWIFVGTPLTPNDLNPPEAPFPEFHNVYIHPDDFAHYESTGEFRDGTVIIKELVSIGSKRATSGVGYFMGEFMGLEAAIKDSNRFPDEPGSWAYYSFGHSYPLKDASEPQDTMFCNACHGANADQDWVFTQYYPVLRAAKPTGSSD